MIARIFQCSIAMLILAGFETIAQTVRVTALDLSSTELSRQPLSETALQLKAVTPDVILLKGVTGWKMAAQLAEMLRPSPYHVAACSAFAHGTNAKQVAILSQKTAYLLWSEAWKRDDNSPTQDGLTFAAIEVEKHRFGFFALELPQSETAIGPAIEQWLGVLNSYRGWSDNRLEGFLAATFRPIPREGEPARIVRSAGFSEIPVSSTNLSMKQIVEGHLVPNAESAKGLLLSQRVVTCDFDFQAPQIIVVVTNSVPVAVQTLPSATRANAALLAQPGIWWIAFGLGLLLFVIVALLIGIRRGLNRLQAQNALVPAGSYNVVVASPTSVTTSALAEVTSITARAPSVAAFSERETAMAQDGFITHFAHWLKQTFVQRLINDRQKLLAEQEVAARKVSTVDERLARLETKIQQQTAAYEKEIELLNQKLLTAREENLELIRSQIKFLKSEMETTRARVLESEV
jgi:hypothetical protein